MSFFTTLACMIGLGCSSPLNVTKVSWSSFGKSILDVTSSDGDMVIFNGMDNPGYKYKQIPTFVVGDEKLSRFLGVEKNSAVILEMYDDRSDFNIYDYEASLDYPWGKKILKDFKQSNGRNEELDLDYGSEIISDTVQVTLVYEDVKSALKYAKMISLMKSRFPSVLYRCWDIIESDIGKHDFNFPAIVVSSESHGDKLYALHGRVTKESLFLFIEANVFKNNDFIKSKTEKKTVYRSEL